MVLKKKNNEETLNFTVMDSLLVDELTGSHNNPFSVFEGRIPNEDVLLADTNSKEDNPGLDTIYTRRIVSAFWRGDYGEAHKWSEQTSTIPSSQMPRITLIMTVLSHLYYIETGKARSCWT